MMMREQSTAPSLSVLAVSDAERARLSRVKGTSFGFAGAIGVSDSPRRALARLHHHLATRAAFYWDDFSTEIHPSARVSPRAYVAERNVRVGADSEIGPNATVDERTIIGQGVMIYAGAVLGSVGLQAGMADGEITEFVHAGGIRIEDCAQVFANAVIARAIFRQFTTISKNCRVGNLAFISHNAQIGEATFVGHGSVVNGNVRTGACVWLGPGCTLIHCVTIGEHARISAGSTVIQDVPPGGHVTGNIAIEHRRFLRHVASISR
jgi:UDP-3-O-[3-hydroxymyristoyl] glucosamine N-acyltransferase